MPRTPNIQRPHTIHVTLPDEVYAQLALELFSPVERRIPYGAWSELFTRLALDHLQRIQSNDPAPTSQS